MALDPGIPLSIKPIEIDNPLEVFSAIEQVKSQREAAELRRLAAEETRRKAKQQAQIAQAYRQAITKDPTTGRPTVDFPKMMTLVPDEALPDILGALHSDESNQLDVETKTLALNAAREKVLGGAGQAVVAAHGAPSLWQSRLQALRRLKAIDEPTYQLYSQITDPEDILHAAQSWVQNAGGEAAKPQLVERVNAQGQTEKVWVIPKVGESYVQPPSTTSAGYRWAIPPGEKVPRLMSADEIRTTGATAPPPPNPLQLVSVVGPDGKPVLVPEGEAVGKRPGSAAEGPGGVKLSPTQQEDIATMLTVQDLSKTVLERGEAIGWSGVGPVAGRAGNLLAGVGVGDPKAEELRNFIGNIQGTIAKLRGGTAFSPQEKAMLDSYTPTPNDSVLKVKAKLKSLDLFITAKRENMLRVAGGEYTPRDTSAVPTVAKEGDVKPIPGHPGTEQTYRNGKWIRTK